jgi:dipeptidyl aminopeptidase/acylaminoacyl peptidase
VADLAAEPAEAAAARVTRVTRDHVWYGDPQWTSDGRSLIVHANRTADRESVRFSINKNYDLWRIDLSSGKLHQLTSGPGPEVSPRLSPDGKRLLCLSIPRRGSHMDVFNLLMMEPKETNGETRALFDHHADASQARPHLPPLFPLPADCWLTKDHFSYNGADRTATRIQVIDVAQGAAVRETDSPELARRGKTRQSLAPPGDLFLRERSVAQGEVVRWKSFDGQEIEGVLTLPPPGAPDAKKPYKMVLYPHGGPHGRSAPGFDFTVQVLAAHGYAVFQPNFRGSSGYGQKFIDADRGDFGGGDMRDILTGIERLVSQGAVDPKRQFVYGVSYGGFMTSWLIGHTAQFRAAVPQNAVTDLNTMWGLSDLQSWTEWEFRGRPWEVPQAMRDHSPLTYASRVRTPTLILHAANDRRCPLPMGKMFYRALKNNGVKTEMVIYPNEGHGIKQPPHQEDVLRRVLDWFARHDVAKRD